MHHYCDIFEIHHKTKKITSVYVRENYNIPGIPNTFELQVGHG